MHPGSATCRFGPFHLDLERRRLFHGQERVWLPDRSLDVLAILVSRAGEIVSMDDLTRAVWTDLAVTDNSIVKAVSDLRKALDGLEHGAARYIQTLIRKGYRFVAPVERVTPGQRLSNPREPHAVLDRHSAFMDGRAAIETLELGAVDRAREAFAGALRLRPDFVPAHVGMANACVLRHESTRADLEPDIAALVEAEHHAREACRLSPSSGHAWSVFALVRHGQGASRDAVAAAREAITLQPAEWRHHLRLAYVGWGAERLAAATEVLSLCPDMPLAHWFAATVFIARGALDKALEHLRAGCAAQDAQRNAGNPFTTVGLHWLHALVLAARGSVDLAREELRRERGTEDSRQVYARECAANTAYVMGALALRERRREEARTAFEEALARVPGHGLATIGLAASRDERDMARDSDRAEGLGKRAEGEGPRPARSGCVDRAIANAAALALLGKHDEAARVCGDALVRAEPGSAGWLLPIEPLIHASAHRDAWAQTLAVVRARAV